TSMVSGGPGSCPAGNDGCIDITNPGTDNPGVIQTGTPAVDMVKISGADLNVGTTLTGSYVYAANGAGA
ncbi:hypothetical protein, partial [Enterobacter kobei]|uniref:hypothetical protein n=1 Tax=Enterobacter kobei TaxID=208224 RepID=UPI0032AEC327